MGGKKRTSGNDEEYVVEKVVDKRTKSGKV